MAEHEAELRLALVCYGGVSLAVYMHGVTKELHKLLRAARKFDEHPVDNPFDGGTEAVYFDALTDIAATGPRLMVSIDIVGGTSAGGINGIALSKAIARNAGLEPLKKVWIDNGDIRKLLRGTTWFGLTVQVLTTAAAQLARLFGSSSPLRGEYMSRLLLDALTKMDEDREPEAPSLLPGKAPELELYVPTTDLSGYEALVPSGIGGASNRDRDYRQVLVFHSVGGGLEQFGETYTADLAFAGRASASFPGAFAPVSQASFRQEVGEDVALHPETVFLCQYGADRTDDVYFVDGGVLDNAPFDLVVDAIARRRAQSRVYRQLVYIEPDPGQSLYAPIGKPEATTRRWLKDLFAVSTVKGSHPILRELTKLRDMNWRIAEVQAIAEQQERYVQDRTNAVLCDMLPHRDTARLASATTTQLVEAVTASSALPADEVIKTVSDTVYDRAQKSLGATWSTYQRLKFETVLKRLADEINVCLGFSKPSAKAGFVSATLIAWARQHPAWQHGHENTEALGKMLRDSDMSYRERRLVFILAGINDLYDLKEAIRPPIPDVDTLKARVWTMIEEIRAGTLAAVGLIKQSGGLDLLRVDDTDAVAVDPETFARDEHNKAEIQRIFDEYAAAVKPLSPDSEKLLTTFRTVTENWTSAQPRDSLLNRYLGFALWDGILFPTISLSELPQLSPIPVAQFSPLTATALAPPAEGGAKPVKLKGIPVKHFAAFFAAKYRENDYLWGRLDGAEQILRMLYDVARKHAGQSAAAPGQVPPHLANALAAVLDTETDLGRVKTLRKQLANQVETLGQSSVSAVP